MICNHTKRCKSAEIHITDVCNSYQTFKVVFHIDLYRFAPLCQVVSYIGLYRFVPLCQVLHWFIQICTFMSSLTLIYTDLYLYVKSYIDLYRFAPLCQVLHWFIQICTFMSSLTLIYTDLHLYVKSYIDLYRFAPLCQVLHWFIQICTFMSSQKEISPSEKSLPPCPVSKEDSFIFTWTNFNTFLKRTMYFYTLKNVCTCI
jgi:hypothetical protein